MKRKTLRDRAAAWWWLYSQLEMGERKHEEAAWLAGYRAGKRDGKAEAMKAAGWET